jgi:NAD(P)-dependent dehydrogenase (short-subunit alcohol dehydrogenase family)
MTKDQTKIALVTGSSRGLGKNTVLSLAKKGVDAIVTYHNSDEEAKSVVSAIASLLSAENRWVNGQRIEVSGGQFL